MNGGLATVIHYRAEANLDQDARLIFGHALGPEIAMARGVEWAARDSLHRDGYWRVIGVESLPESGQCPQT